MDLRDSDTSLAQVVQNIARGAGIALMLQTDKAYESVCHNVSPSLLPAAKFTGTAPLYRNSSTDKHYRYSNTVKMQLRLC